MADSGVLDCVPLSWLAAGSFLMTVSLLVAPIFLMRLFAPIYRMKLFAQSLLTERRAPMARSRPGEDSCFGR